MLEQRKLLNGDHIFHQQYGSGIILRADLSYGILVHFDDYGDMCVPLKTLSQIVSRKSLIAKIIEVFHSDFLSADMIFADDPDAALLNREEYNDLKNRFVQSWAKRELDLSLDIEQAAAIASTNGNIQVIARAGSGKTRTLVARAIFLQKHCQISPHELLLLAFNKKAAQEIKERLAQTLGANLPHVMTFHALAYALVHPEEELIFDDVSADQLGLSREVQAVIDNHIRSKEYSTLIRNLMLAHFREDWERIVDGRFQLTMMEFLKHQRALPRESLKGDYVKSFGEKSIANALFEHGIEYKYERNHRWKGVNYRPDFTIPLKLGGGVIIEYFGLSGDPDYDEMSKQKRQFWDKQVGWTFIEFSPKDLMQQGPEAFTTDLIQKLRKIGLICQRRSEEEIWQVVKTRALDSFTDAMKTFVGRCRKRGLMPANIASMVAVHTPCSTAEALFLKIGVPIYRDYLQRLKVLSKEDFDGLIWRSVVQVNEGQTRFIRDKGKENGDIKQLRFILIDEFQDFSQMFLRLVDSMRSANPRIQFFCVGDDWQAINGFAGSDLRYFRNFQKYFQNASQLYIRTNYRSPRLIVKVGNAVMNGLGSAAKSGRTDAGLVWLCKLNNLKISATEQAIHKGDEVTPAILRLVRYFLNRDQDVVILSRRKGIPWYINYNDNTYGVTDALSRFLEHIRSNLPEEDRKRVTISTAHGYKGLEASAVIVVDAVDRSYPLVHPAWVFLRVFGDSIDRLVDEERRLFYVAITRAKQSLALVTESNMESPYLGNIHQLMQIESLSWEKLTPVAALDSPRIEVRVLNAYSVKDQLKDRGYQYNPHGKYWQKALPVGDFSLDELLQQTWSKANIKIEVYNEEGKLLHRR